MKTIFSMIFLFLCGVVSAQFSADTTKTNCPGLITFTDSTLGAKAWEWNFGDEWTGTGNPCMHPYTYPGVYTVSCKVTFSDGSHQLEVKPDYITILAKSEVIEYTYTAKKEAVKVYDITGRFIQYGEDLRNLPAGIYIVNNKKIFKK